MEINSFYNVMKKVEIAFQVKYPIEQLSAWYEYIKEWDIEEFNKITQRIIKKNHIKPMLADFFDIYNEGKSIYQEFKG